MRRNAWIYQKKDAVLIACSLFASCWLPGCNNDEPGETNARETIDYIRPIAGKSDSIPAEVAKKGEVLMSYSDCHTCHKAAQKSVGPAFKDIAKRYPVNKVYIEMLARKVINGGSRSWGYAVMDPHPKLSIEDAKKMVTYILSMRN